MTGLATSPPAVEPSSRAPAGSATLAGTGVLVRFILRRDRVRLPAWIGGIAFVFLSSAQSLPQLYADAADRQARADLMDNPGLRAFTGPAYGLDDYTFGAMVAHEYLAFAALFAVIMSFLLMSRHTRAEEESLRADLVRAGVVGRHAPLAAALIVVGGANVVLGATLAVGLGGLGIEAVDWSGSWLFGASLASVGLVFTAVAAVAAQVSQTSRAASSLVGALFAGAFVVRAAGDMQAVGGSALSWLSPIGWAQQTRAYVDGRWWPLLPSVVLVVSFVVVALTLNSRRDVGAGLIRPRPGAATAAPWLSSAWGIAWRLHRTSVTWWAVLLFSFGFGYGFLASEIESFVEDLSTLEDWMADIGGDSILDAWLSVMMLMFAIGATVFAVLVTLRLRTEETSGRAEPVLATSVPQHRWVASHAIIALLGSAGLLALSGAGLGISVSIATDDAGRFGELVGAALAYIPAVWVTVGMALLLFGWVPRATMLVWILIAYAGLAGMFADLFGLPGWVLSLSPFDHVPALPAVAMSWTPVVALALLGVVLMVVGTYGFRQRDLEGS